MPNQFTEYGTIEERFWKKVEKSDGCWLWVGNCATNGYGRLCVNYVTIRAHRLSWQIHFGEIPDGLLVCHKCDVRNCVRPDHLFLGTVQDNTVDMWQKGRALPPNVRNPESRPRGSRNGNSKLTEADIAAIRVRLADGETQTSISRDFGVFQSTISTIALGKTWRE